MCNPILKLSFFFYNIQDILSFHVRCWMIHQITASGEGIYLQSQMFYNFIWSTEFCISLDMLM